MNILSITINHDASVCLLKDGKILYFLKEERLSRVKRDSWPFLSLFKLGEVFKDRIDYCLFHIMNTSYLFERDIQNYEYIVKKLIKKLFIVDEIEIINYSEMNHHDAHANISFYNSGFNRALVFVSDAGGSTFKTKIGASAIEAFSVYLFNKDNKKELLHKRLFALNFNKTDDLAIENIKKDLTKFYGDFNKIDLSFDYHIGAYYSNACNTIGEEWSEGGKVMGLSSYGNLNNIKNLEIKKFEEYKQVKDFIVHKHFNSPNEITKTNFKPYADFCNLIQKTSEQDFLKYIKKYTEATKVFNVCLSGGYANNIVANSFFKKHLPHINFYYEPVCDDSGISIGLAYDYYTNLKPSNTIIPPVDNFYVYCDNEKINFSTDTNSSLDKVLDLFLQQKTIAIFEGQPEAGQRALGHRSIIFDPRNKDGKHIVNLIKRREWYRPFAAVIRKEDLKNYFFDDGFNESQNMMINFRAKDITIKNYPSIVHVDNTCRIQTVTNGFFYNLLTLLVKKDNCYMMLNTSFNLAGEPLVHCKLDALRCFNSSQLDAIYFVDENKLILK